MLLYRHPVRSTSFVYFSPSAFPFWWKCTYILSVLISVDVLILHTTVLLSYFPVFLKILKQYLTGSFVSILPFQILFPIASTGFLHRSHSFIQRGNCLYLITIQSNIRINELPLRLFHDSNPATTFLCLFCILFATQYISRGWYTV